MIKFPVSYTANNKAIEPEQAAGFPPFTRGYSCVYKNIQLTNDVKTDFSIFDYKDETLVNLFKSLFSSKSKGLIKLSIPPNVNNEILIYLRLLRCLLSVISKEKYSDPKYVFFEFYGATIKHTNNLNTLILAKAAQVDFLIIDDTEYWHSLQNLCPTVPVDNMYGSDELETQTEKIFCRLYPLIMNSLT